MEQEKKTFKGRKGTDKKKDRGMGEGFSGPKTGKILTAFKTGEEEGGDGIFVACERGRVTLG